MPFRNPTGRIWVTLLAKSATLEVLVNKGKLRVLFYHGNGRITVEEGELLELHIEELVKDLKGGSR